MPLELESLAGLNLTFLAQDHRVAQTPKGIVQAFSALGVVADHHGRASGGAQHRRKALVVDLGWVDGPGGRELQEKRATA